MWRPLREESSIKPPRELRVTAEAIWRFFLTDGRFVKPGMIYHIAGWAYEEPAGGWRNTDCVSFLVGINRWAVPKSLGV
jgi:hypothetical protein